MPSPEIIAHWPVHAAGMEPLEAITSPSLKAIVTFAALLWLVYRAYQVMVIKEDALIKLLGLDVPAAPSVSLAGIKADGATLHWEPAESRSGVMAYQIKVNGILVEEVGPKETSITINNLKPGVAYIVRIIAINQHNFQSPSDPIQFRTKPPVSDDFFDFAAYNRTLETANDAEHESDERWWVEPKVQPCRNFLEPTSPVPAPEMVRTHSNSQSHPRRIPFGRRSSPATGNSYNQGDDAGESSETGETEMQLQAKGDRLRSDIATIKKAMDDEEKTFKEQKEILSQRHNELKDELARKTAASNELKKEVANLEKENQRAQAKKTAEEKALQQKLAERSKMRDDVQRFKVEKEGMAAEIERIEQQKRDYQTNIDSQMQELREKHAEEQQTIKGLEESVREIGIQNRLLEEERRRLESGESEQEGLPKPDYVEEDRQWNEKIRSLQARYSAAWAGLQAAERAYGEAQNQLNLTSARAASQSQIYRPPVLDSAPSRRTSQRRRHAGSFGNDNISAAPGFPITTTAPFNASISSISSGFGDASQYFNIANGAVPIPPNLNRESLFSPADIDMLTGGAPMSPNAGDLLPSGLFADETDRSADEAEDDESDVPAIPGLGAPQAQEPFNRSPSSPASAQSRSPSLFASPRASSNQLPIGPPQDAPFDNDGRSVKSLSNSARGVHAINNNLQSRFSTLFTRQRGKTLSEDGPTLGSLNKNQSHSLPRPEYAEQDPIGTQRRRGSHSGSSWMDSMAKPFRSSTTSALDEKDPPSSHIKTRTRFYKLFPSKDETPWAPAFGMERPSSPRPGSTRSFGDAMQLPRPSTELGRFGWGPELPGQRSSPLNPDLGINPIGNFSRHPSRRPSIQYGPSGGMNYEEMLAGNSNVLADDFDFPVTQSPQSQPPIGTRPQSQPQPAPDTPPSGKLNPAAPNFKSLFSRSAGAEKSKSKAKPRDFEDEPFSFDGSAANDFASSPFYSPSPNVAAVAASANESPFNPLEGSPTSQRKSRDGRASTMTSDGGSLVLSASWSPRASLDRTSSRTPSENLTPSIASAGKESWMSKLSRKGSSGKFQLPGFGGRDKERGWSSGSGGGFFSRGRAADEGANSVDEDALATEPPTPGLPGSGSVGGSPVVGGEKEKKGDRSSGLSWSSLRRKKKGEKAPSINESVASERTEDEDELDARAPPEGLGVTAIRE